MRKFYNLILISVLFTIGWGKYCSAEMPEKGNITMKNAGKVKGAEAKYRNISTAPSYIKIKFKDPGSDEVFNMIVENTDMVFYLANKRGLEMIQKDSEAFKKFAESDYVNYMVENEGKLLDFDIDDFISFVSKSRFGNRKSAETYLKSLIFGAPLTLKQLNVNNEKELIEKYFVFNSDKSQGSLKEEYNSQYSLNPAFIALLVDLGYNVGRGDVFPILYISK